MIVKMIKYLRKRKEALTKKIEEIFHRDPADLRTEMNNTITEMKNTLAGNNSRINEAEKQIRSQNTDWCKSLPWITIKEKE